MKMGVNLVTDINEFLRAINPILEKECFRLLVKRGNRFEISLIEDLSIREDHLIDMINDGTAMSTVLGLAKISRENEAEYGQRYCEKENKI